MATSIFDLVSDALEANSDLEKLEARGTVRLALKQAGLDARGVTATQMTVVLAQVLPVELKARGVEQPEAVCAAIDLALKAEPAAEDPLTSDDESPEAVFRRLARS